MGLDNKSHIIYVLDLGLSQKYRHSRTHQHIKFRENIKFTGTARYASINALKGCEQSRRDDLEAIGYVLMYFLRSSLPWQGLHASIGEDKYNKILTKKRGTSGEELCKGFPKEFVEYINYTRNLEFEAEPDYKFLRGLLLSVLEKENQPYDFFYDWVSEKPTITDQVALERYKNKNYNVSLEILVYQKEREEEYKNNVNEKKNNMDFNHYKGLNNLNSSNDSTEPKTFSSSVGKPNDMGINISAENYIIYNNNVGKNEEFCD